MQHLEHQHQKALIAWAYMAKLAPASDVIEGASIGEYLFAIPNGGKRNPREAARLKAEGAKAGVSDLMLPLRRGGFCGLWLELKAPGNKPTHLQRAWLERMDRAGYRAEWCDDWRKAADIITDYLDGSPARVLTIQNKKGAATCSASSKN